MFAPSDEPSNARAAEYPPHAHYRASGRRWLVGTIRGADGRQANAASAIAAWTTWSGPGLFRREAVQLLLAGRTPRELTESLGVSEQTLRNWRWRAQLDRGERDEGPASDEREELRRRR